MRCPRCHNRTEIIETHSKSERTRRRRQCLTPSCQYRFTTVEQSAAEVRPVAQGEVEASLKRMGARPGSYDAEALAAALAVDRRKAEMARESRRKRRVEVFEDEDRAPAWLNREGLRREMSGY